MDSQHCFCFLLFTMEGWAVVCFCFICLRRHPPVHSETTSKSTRSLNFIDKVMQKESEERQLNSWAVALFFAFVIFYSIINKISLKHLQFYLFPARI